MRLNAITVLFSAVVATAVPTNVKHEATVQLTATEGQQDLAAASVPEFVSLTNLSSFLLASEGITPISTDTRLAAEALSAKFASSSNGSEREFLHVVVQEDPVAINLLDAPKDPEKPARVPGSSARNNTVEAPRTAAHIAPRGIARVKTAQPILVKQHLERRRIASIEEAPLANDASTGAPLSDLAEQAMSPMLSKCRSAPKPCQGNETWCEC